MILSYNNPIHLPETSEISKQNPESLEDDSLITSLKYRGGSQGTSIIPSRYCTTRLIVGLSVGSSWIHQRAT
eukprot:c14640_g1_i1 orf=305-520(+)